jgi:hypothetical protein
VKETERDKILVIMEDYAQLAVQRISPFLSGFNLGLNLPLIAPPFHRLPQPTAGQRLAQPIMSAILDGQNTSIAPAVAVSSRFVDAVRESRYSQVMAWFSIPIRLAKIDCNGLST